MSQFNLLDSNREPEFASAYSTDAGIILAQADSLDALRTMPDGAAKLIITSPPYNIGK